MVESHWTLPIPPRWRRVGRFLLQRVLHANDPPHRLALGVAIGLFVMFTPTIGFQMALVVFLAWLLGANKLVGLPVVWLSNPATIVPMYYACYVVGRGVIPGSGVGPHWWAEFSSPPAGWWPKTLFYWSQFVDVAAPLWAGGIILGAVVAVVGYYGAYQLICGYRLRRWGQLTRPRKRARPRATAPEPVAVE